MKVNRILVTVMAAAVVFSAFGCGGTGAAGSAAEPASEPAAGSTTKQADAETAAEDADAASTGSTVQTASQNPIMNYAGAYREESTEDFNLMLEDLDGIEGVHITVVKSNPEEPYVYWEADGVIDQDLKITYTGAIKGQLQFTEDGDTEETVFYEDGTGSIQIGEDGKVTWQDDKEDAGKDCVFVFDQDLTDELMEMNTEESADPLLNWAGAYSDSSTIGRTMNIEALEDPLLCKITITNEEENMTVTQWTMQGEFNEADMTIEYKDCRKIRGSIDQGGTVTEEETFYENGTGKLILSRDSDTIEWIDDVEDMGNGAVFVYNYDYSGFGNDGSTDEEAYAPEEDAEFLEDYYEDEDVEDEDLEYGADDDSNDTSTDEE